MRTLGRRRLSPGLLLRPRRVRRLARNAMAFYVLSKAFRRPHNRRRQMLRRKYAPPRGLVLLGWLLRARRWL